MDMEAIKQAILEGNFSQQELRGLNSFVVEEIKAWRNREARRRSGLLSEGSRVAFTSKGGKRQEGTVLSVKKTNAVVHFDGDPDWKAYNVNMGTLEILKSA